MPAVTARSGSIAGKSVNIAFAEVRTGQGRRPEAVPFCPLIVKEAAKMPPERHKPWTEKNPFVAGVLAFLVPGLGHFYQGRFFKGVIYFVCILGAYFGGMRLGEGAVVYQGPMRTVKNVTLTFLAQTGVGLPSIIALGQSRRADAASNRPMYELPAPLSARFDGVLVATGLTRETPVGHLSGEITLETVHGGNLPETRGKFRGTLDGKPKELELSSGFYLDRPISAGYRRRLECHVAHSPDERPETSFMIRGFIPRPLVDAFNAPADPGTVQDLHDRLGKLYDLAIAFTMIAGLLNILAIWDAIEGPAYGFGDEEPSTNDSTSESATKSANKA